MMSTKDRKVFVMALALMALMSICIPVVSAAIGSQDWYLCTDPKLDKTAPGSGSYVSPAAGWSQSHTGPAQCSLTMGSGTWTLYLDYNAPCAGCIWLNVKKPPNTDLASAICYPIPSAGAGTITVAMTNGQTVDFSTDDTIRLDLYWAPDAPCTTDLTVNCGSGKSKLSSPDADPGFPVPEMSTLVLFSIGVLALAGYVAYRRRGI